MWPIYPAYNVYGQGNAWQTPYNVYNHHRQYMPQNAQSSSSWSRGADHVCIGAAGVAPDWDRNTDHSQQQGIGNVAPAPARLPPKPYEVMATPRSSTPPSVEEDTAAPEIVVAEQIDCDDWDKTHIRNWRRLLKDVRYMKKPDDKVTAINTLIDSFHRLNLAKDQEDLIDLIYDYCEPDVSLEVRQ